MATRLIYNPTAGGGRARTLVDRLSHELAQIPDLEVVATRAPGHARELSAAVKDRADQLVISVGGDGTHHEVANGLLPDGLAEMALIPAGSGNDFAGFLGIPKDPQAALRAALDTPARPIDVGKVNEEFFLTVVGAGFDAEVAAYINERPKAGNGQLAYLGAILKMLSRYECKPLSVSLDGEARSRSTLLLACGNTGRYAGGIKICPRATPFDGQLDVVWVGGLSRLRILPLLARAYSGSHVHHPAVETFLATRLRVEGPPGYHVHADGELVGELPVTIEVVPGALRLRVPGQPA
ncbi:MAG: diacylglycerol/lipid kinase family protein [Clostridia bacterium]